MLRVRYLPTQGASNFLVGDIAGNNQEAMLNFNNGKTATLELEIYDDDVAEENGFVQVLLLDDDASPVNYTVSAATVSGKPDDLGSVAVSDNDTLITKPTISLSYRIFTNWCDDGNLLCSC